MRVITIAGFIAVAIALSVRQSAPLHSEAYPPPSSPWQYATQYQYPSPAAAMMPAQTPQPIYAQARCRGPGGLDIGDYAWVKSPTPDDIKNGGWEVCPGKVVMPATFCRWAWQVLPEAQQKTCYALHLKTDPAAYKPNWKRFEADNGAIYALDMNSISHLYYCGGCTDVVVCIVDNNMCLPPNVRRFRFDCHGHYMDTTNGGGSMQIAPPRSVVGQMAALACVGAKDQ
jgi:hypothetical protein